VICFAIFSFYSLGNASSNDTLDDTDRLEYLKSYIEGTLVALRLVIQQKNLTFFSRNVISGNWGALLQNHQSLDTATRMLFCSAGMEPM
jgi:hypothetical protein